MDYFSTNAHLVFCSEGTDREAGGIGRKNSLLVRWLISGLSIIFQHAIKLLSGRGRAVPPHASFSAIVAVSLFVSRPLVSSFFLATV